MSDTYIRDRQRERVAAWLDSALDDAQRVDAKIVERTGERAVASWAEDELEAFSGGADVLDEVLALPEATHGAKLKIYAWALDESAGTATRKLGQRTVQISRMPVDQRTGSRGVDAGVESLSGAVVTMAGGAHHAATTTLGQVLETSSHATTLLLKQQADAHHREGELRARILVLERENAELHYRVKTAQDAQPPPWIALAAEVLPALAPVIQPLATGGANALMGWGNMMQAQAQSHLASIPQPSGPALEPAPPSGGPTSDSP